MIRLLVPHAADGEVTVEGARLHYVARVLRLETGDALEVFDGAGLRFDAKVTALDDVKAVLALSNKREAPKSRPITVIQGLPKADKLELVLQKCTELGATNFIAASCTRSIVKLDGKEENKRTRWQRIVEEAARQCGRADVPEVHGPVKLLDSVKLAGPDVGVLVLDEEEKAVPLSVGAAQFGERPLALVIGPEGGLSREEVQALVKNGAVAVTLGSRILRTETAGLAALSVLRHLDGEFG